VKITKRQLRRIIKEEKARLLNEQPDIPDVMGAMGGGKFQPRKSGKAAQGKAGPALDALYSAIDNLTKVMGSEEARLELQGIVEDWQ